MLKACDCLSNMMRSVSILPKESRGFNDTNEVQEYLQFHDLSIGEYVTDKHALWLNFRMIDENILHRTGREIESRGGGITLQIEKKAEAAGVLKVYISLIMDAQ